jgi:hypothetical protein
MGTDAVRLKKQGKLLDLQEAISRYVKRGMKLHLACFQNQGRFPMSPIF